MNVRIYFSYTSCVEREIEVENESEIEQAIEDIRCEISDEDIIRSIVESNVDYDIYLSNTRRSE